MNRFRRVDARPLRIALLLTSALVLGLFASVGQAETEAETKAEAAIAGGAAAAEQRFAEGGVETCLRCHDNAKVTAVFATPHMKPGTHPSSPAAKEQCESCHGPSASHVRFPLHVGNIRFTRRDDTTTKATRNRACLECHLQDEPAHWQKSPHGFDEIACVDCHAVHTVSDPILSKETQTQRCAEGCHMEILQTQPAGTPHPLQGEKALLCTDCHDPHGPLDLDACTACHSQKPAALAAQSAKARAYHERALAEKIACTECHQGFVHPLPESLTHRFDSSR